MLRLLLPLCCSRAQCQSRRRRKRRRTRRPPRRLIRYVALGDALRHNVRCAEREPDERSALIHSCSMRTLRKRRRRRRRRRSADLSKVTAHHSVSLVALRGIDPLLPVAEAGGSGRNGGSSRAPADVTSAASEGSSAPLCAARSNASLQLRRLLVIRQRPTCLLPRILPNLPRYVGVIRVLSLAS